MEKSDSIKTNVAWNIMYQIVTVLVPLLTQPYISRALGADSIGIYSHTTASMTYFSLFATLGTATYGTREIARHRYEPWQRTKLFLEIELLSVLTSCLAIIGWGIFILFASREYRICYLILTLELFSMMFDITWFFNGIEKFRSTALKSMVVRIGYAAATLLFVKKPSDIYLYMLILSIASVSGNLSLWFALPKYLVKINKKMIKSLRVLRHFRQTFIFFIPTISGQISNLIDTSLIHVMTGSNADNGYYEQATKIIALLESVTFISVNNVLSSHNSMLYKAGDKKGIKQLVHRSTDLFLAFGIGVLFGLPIAAKSFVPFFFGKGWEDTILLLQIFSPLLLIVGISNTLARQYFTPAGKQAKSALYVMIGGAVDIIGDLILIPLFGTAGACLATVIDEAVITILYIIHDDGILTVRKLIYLSWRKVLAGIIMLIYIHFIDVSVSSYASAFFIEVIGGILIYVCMLKVLHDPFSRTMDGIFQKVKMKFKHSS